MDVVYGVEDEPSAWHQLIQSPFYFFSNFSGCPKGQDMLSVAATSPENEVFAVFWLQFTWVHASRCDLDRVQDVYSGVDQVGYERLYRSIGVEEDGRVTMCFHEMTEFGVVGLDPLPIGPG